MLLRLLVCSILRRCCSDRVVAFKGFVICIESYIVFCSMVASLILNHFLPANYWHLLLFQLTLFAALKCDQPRSLAVTRVRGLRTITDPIAPEMVLLYILCFRHHQEWVRMLLLLDNMNWKRTLLVMYFGHHWGNICHCMPHNIVLWFNKCLLLKRNK